jgi:hypothetical protein
MPRDLPAVSFLLKNLIQRKFPEQFAAQGKDQSTRESTAASKAAERARKEGQVSETKRKISQMQSHFRVGGVVLDPDTLQVILEMCQGDVKQAIAFLELQGEPEASYVDIADLNRENPTVPKDYAQNPAGMTRLERSVRPTLLESLKDVLLGDRSTYSAHLQAQTDSRNPYFALLKVLLIRGVEISHGSKSRCLAAVFARRDTEMSRFLLGAEAQGLLNPNSSLPDVFGLPDILKSIKILDTNRQIRVKERKIAKLEALGAGRGRAIGQLRSDIADLQRELVPRGSLSGSLAKFIKKTILSQIPPAKLEYFALQLPAEPWKELADLLHMNPARDLTVPWFLPRAFGTAPPADCIVSRVAGMNTANLVDILSKEQPPLSFVRTKVPHLTGAAKKLLAGYVPVNQLLWWHHELYTPEVDEILVERLKAGDLPTLPYGKLMERLMYFQELGSTAIFENLLPVAEQRLQSIHLSLESPVAVIGDASFSMDVAIRASVIIGSVIAVLSNASLTFFNSVSFQPASIPTTAQECIHVASITRAKDQTAPAAALWDFYSQRKEVKTFIVVTDERENQRAHGFYFHQLFYKYYTEVYPARIVLVSFLEANAKGQMATALEALGITPIKYSFDARRPDLTKFDGLLGLLSTTSDSFASDLAGLAAPQASAAPVAAPVEASSS